MSSSRENKEFTSELPLDLSCLQKRWSSQVTACTLYLKYISTGRATDWVWWIFLLHSEVWRKGLNCAYAIEDSFRYYFWWLIVAVTALFTTFALRDVSWKYGIYFTGCLQLKWHFCSEVKSAKCHLTQGVFVTPKWMCSFHVCKCERQLHRHNLIVELVLFFILSLWLCP